ncbi:MAG: DUF732 domain-containing protein [Mycobacterium sp.]
MTDDQPPTKLARPVDATEASLAWSIDDSPEVAPYRPRWIARTAVAGALVLIAGAGTLALVHVQKAPESTPVAAPVGTTTTVTIAPAVAEPTLTSATPVPTTTTKRPDPEPVETAAMRRPPPETVTVQAPVPMPVRPTLAQLNVVFIDSLRQQGWTIFQPDLMITRAHQACDEFAVGSSPAYVNEWLVNAGNISDYESAAVFTSTARYVYGC